MPGRTMTDSGGTPGWSEEDGLRRNSWVVGGTGPRKTDSDDTLALGLFDHTSATSAVTESPPCPPPGPPRGPPPCPPLGPPPGPP
ncbi:hypothetical protein LR48_Vigan07g054100 [Vigna angularis]|uniref:Uncharacterized protein n=1 Tax=Phaseolus angularis TaxID=3914 RepID=A0A0L9UW75_PHAAN|nr:hypothetical protein LR48_Vigan07g054100 [Vigna angularis]